MESAEEAEDAEDPLPNRDQKDLQICLAEDAEIREPYASAPSATSAASGFDFFPSASLRLRGEYSFAHARASLRSCF